MELVVLEKGNRVIILILFTLVFSFVFFASFSHNVFSKEASKITISIKSSPEAINETKLTIYQSKIIKEIVKSPLYPSKVVLPFTDTYITINQQSGVRRYLADQYGNLFDVRQLKKVHLPAHLQEQLFTYIEIIKRKHYGELLPWEEVDTIIPRKTKFQVIDLETGLRFNVQRRAGSHHADVQPLSKEDTKIMREIFEGKWSWDRRAILIQIGNQRIAASMNGMPHGFGALRNGFPGHFCIHFKGSITHITRNLDPGHQVMVYKAAGKIEQYLITLNPYDLVDVFLMSLNQNDKQLFKMLLSKNKYKEIPSLLVEMDKIDTISRTTIFDKTNTFNLMSFEIPIEVNLYWKEGGREKRKMNFLLKRNSVTDRWTIDFEELFTD